MQCLKNSFLQPLGGIAILPILLFLETGRVLHTIYSMSYTTLPPQQADWQSFIDVFLAKNAQLNLSAIRDAEGVFVKHICDALE